MKIGFELEAFVQEIKTGNLLLVHPSLPYDECGWLAEIRSEPHSDITKALYLLKAEQVLVHRKAADIGVKLVYEPLMEVPRHLKVAAARKHGKGLIHYRNLYGHETHRNPTKLQTASLHVSVSNDQLMWFKHRDGSSESRSYPGFIDHARLVMGLDAAFKAEIRAAKRNPGFYEVKGTGRIEYRSLPNTIDLDKLGEVLTTLLPKVA